MEQKAKFILIDTLVRHYAEDMDMNDMIKIFKEDDEQLINRLVRLIEYYESQVMLSVFEENIGPLKDYPAVTEVLTKPKSI